MLLAARALGLGATLTTLYLLHEKEAEAAMGLPPDVHSYALLPIGWPEGKFGPVRRVPLADVVYEDKWGKRIAARSYGSSSPAFHGPRWPGPPDSSYRKASAPARSGCVGSAPADRLGYGAAIELH
jgi:hypothetical protein